MQKQERVKAEDIVPALRAHVVNLLTSRYGFSKKKTADLLGITPAAVIQYLKGKRGTRLRSLIEEKEASLVIEELAKRLAGGIDTTIAELGLIEAAHQIISFRRGASTTPSKPQVNVEAAIILNSRRVLEIKTAQRCLKGTDDIKDELVEVIFRQIAGDSLRHADILSHILARLDRLNEPRLAESDLGMLRNILDIEDAAGDRMLSNLLEGCSPTIKALLASIDVDEMKHTRMLQIALGQSVEGYT